MTSEELGSKYRRLINDTSTLNDNEYYGAEYFMLPNESGTTHVSIVSENGDAVAVSTTINEWYIFIYLPARILVCVFALKFVMKHYRGSKSSSYEKSEKAIT